MTHISISVVLIIIVIIALILMYISKRHNIDKFDTINGSLCDSCENRPLGKCLQCTNCVYNTDEGKCKVGNLFDNGSEILVNDEFRRYVNQGNKCLT